MRTAALLAAVLGLSFVGVARAQTVEEVTGTAAMPLRGGAITLKVSGYDAARQEVLKIAAQEGAVAVDGRTFVAEKGRRHGWLRLRVSRERLPALLAAVRGTGTLYGENLATDDRSRAYSELAARVRRLQEHQERLSGVLESREKRLRGSDILYVQERLFRAGVDEDLLREERAALARKTRQSSVIVTLFEPIPVGRRALAHRAFGEQFALALGWARNAAGRQTNRAATALAYALVFAPVWVPLLTLGLILLLVVRRTLSRQKTWQRWTRRGRAWTRSLQAPAPPSETTPAA